MTQRQAREKKARLPPSLPKQLHDDSMVSRISLNDYLEVAAVAYRAIRKELEERPSAFARPDIEHMSPREMYDRFAEKRRGVFLTLAPDDKAAFRKWHRSGAWKGLHPFEIITSSGGGICLYPSGDKPCYKLMCNDEWLSRWYVKIVEAFRAHGIPVEASDLERATAWK